jgi:hypothetical protein
MNLPLNLHPDSRSPVKRIEVEFRREASGLLRLTYHVFGALDQVKIPATQPPDRTDELWKHSCFEAFVSTGTGYYEINLSPSSQWAAYRFDGHRTGMRYAAMAAPRITWREGAGQGTLSASLELPANLAGPFGLSAIIEDTNGNRAFWALAHPPGAPDFHHAACFAAELPSAG